MRREERSDSCYNGTLQPAQNNLVSFFENAIHQHDINCCSKAFNDLDFQDSTLQLTDEHQFLCHHFLHKKPLSKKPVQLIDPKSLLANLKPYYLMPRIQGLLSELKCHQDGPNSNFSLQEVLRSRSYLMSLQPACILERCPTLINAALQKLCTLCTSQAGPFGLESGKNGGISMSLSAKKIHV